MQYKSKVGGILTIISGVFGILEFFAMILMIFVVNMILTSPEFGADYDSQAFLSVALGIYGVAGLVFLILGTMGIVGGIYATKKRLWGLALAGAICSILTFLPIGIAAVIFIAQAQKEFVSSSTGGDAAIPETVNQL